MAKKITLRALIALLAGLWTVIAAAPFVFMVFNSFKDKFEMFTGGVFAPPKALRWANYYDIITKGTFFHYVLNSVIVVVASLIVCISTWIAIEKTKLGAYLRAATENPVLVQDFGINVPRLVTLTYAFGVALAGLAGVLAAPV